MDVSMLKVNLTGRGYEERWEYQPLPVCWSRCAVQRSVVPSGESPTPV